MENLTVHIQQESPNFLESKARMAIQNNRL